MKIYGKLKAALNDIKHWEYADSETGDAFTQRISRRIGNAIGAAPRCGSPDIDEIIQKGITVFEQPYGTQLSPDIAIVILDTSLKIKNKTGWIPENSITIEVKRSATGKVLWNSGFPTQNRIYILNTKTKFNSGTTMVLGSDLVDEIHEQTVGEIRNELKELKKEKQNIGNFKLVHLRPMYSESAPKCYWLSHKDRKEREKRVIKHLRKQINIGRL